MSEEIRSTLDADRSHRGLVMNPVEKVLTGLVVGVIIAFVIGAFLVDKRFDGIEKRQATIVANQTAGKERTFESRSLDCRILVSLGQVITQNDPCNAKEVRAYFDPDHVPLTPTASITCDIARQIAATSTSGFKVPEGCGTG